MTPPPLVSETELRNTLEELSAQLSPAVDGRYDFMVRLDTDDESLQKVQMLVNFLLDSVHRNVGLLEDRAIELKTEREHFWRLIEHAPDAIFMTDSEGRVILANRRAEILLGYPRQELIGASIDKLMPERFRSKHPELVKDYMESGASRPMGAGRTVLAVHCDGTEIPVEISLSPLETEAGQMVLSTLRDRRQRVRAEELEIERKSLQAAVEAMEKVLGVVGHELRTPLAGLRVISDLLLTQDMRIPMEAKVFVSNINEEVIRMSEMVNNMLEAARINSGSAQWDWEEFTLSDACHEAIDAMRPLIDHDKVELLCEIDPPDLMMRGDSDAIRRLVLNIVSNACKYTDTGSIRVVAHADESEAGVLVIDVIDTGRGIPEEIMGKLGTAFALNSGSLGAGHIQGSGLGLAICKGIAAAHGGYVAVTTELGVGSCFTIRLRSDLAEPMRDEGDQVIHQEIAV